MRYLPAAGLLYKSLLRATRQLLARVLPVQLNPCCYGSDLYRKVIVGVFSYTLVTTTIPSMRTIAGPYNEKES